MTRKNTTQNSAVPVNEKFPLGDAVEPAKVSDVAPSVDPVELERPADPAPGNSALHETRAPLVSGIDLDALALSDDYEAEAADPDQTVVIIRKATGAGYFRAHPEKWKALTMMEIPAGEDRGFYLVSGEALARLRAVVQRKEAGVKLFPCRLTLCHGRDIGAFLWPLKLPQPRKANQQDEWGQAALRICKMAETQWVEMFVPRGANCYHWRVGEGIQEEPAWSSLSLNELAGIAFEGRYLTDADDPVIRRRLGKE
jgi:hypothetical protein